MIALQSESEKNIYKAAAEAECCCMLALCILSSFAKKLIEVICCQIYMGKEIK